MLTTHTHRQNAALCRHRSARGFSLIEVLVSIVVLSFGLLGMVGMQAAALQSNRDARLQSSAVNLAREGVEMMRGNQTISSLSSGNPYLGSYSNPAGTSPLAPETPNYCLSVSASTPCASTSDVASAQMTEWLQRIDSALPGARVDVCFDSSPFDSNGLPRWTCNNTGTNVVIKMGWTRSTTDRTKTGTAALIRASTPSIIIPVGSAV